MTAIPKIYNLPAIQRQRSSVLSTFRVLVQAAAFLEVKRLRRERDLSTLKWFDYRFTSVTEGTCIFYEIYRTTYQNVWRRDFHVEEAKLKRGGPVRGLFSSSRELNSVWRARQFADELGLPYDFFIREAMEAALRRGARRPPRPNQLYNKRTVKTILERWEERRCSVSLISGLPQYRLEAFRDLPAQSQHQTWVINNLKARAAKPFAIAQACFVQRVVTEARVEAEFSLYELEQIRYEGVSMVAEPAVPLTASAFWPSCFGVPHAHSESSPICSGCHAFSACAQVEAKVRNIIIDQYGSDSPRDNTRRAQGRVRTARHRAMKAAGSARAVKPQEGSGCPDEGL